MKIEDCEMGEYIELEDRCVYEILKIEKLSNKPVLVTRGFSERWISPDEIEKAVPHGPKATPEAEAFRKEQYFAIMRDVIARRVSSVSVSAETDTIAKCVINSLDTAMDYWEQNK